MEPFTESLTLRDVDCAGAFTATLQHVTSFLIHYNGFYSAGTGKLDRAKGNMELNSGGWREWVAIVLQGTIY